MTITVVNKYKPTGNTAAIVIYCGRGSALGNPFALENPILRNIVCDRYHKWFHEHIVTASPKAVKMREQVLDIMAAAVAGDVELQCYCAPKRCHCETIKEHVESLL